MRKITKNGGVPGAESCYLQTNSITTGINQVGVKVAKGK